MGRGMGVWMGCAILLLAAASAQGAQELNEKELRAAMKVNEALEEYVDRNGYPDVAEARTLADRPPWDDHEITLYYLGRRRAISFARAYVLGRPEVSLMRSERPLSDAQVAALASRPRLDSDGGAMGPVSDGGAMGPVGSGPAARAEDAARRAEGAADRIDATAPVVEQAAARTESVLARLVHGK